jgi:flagellar basal-body rod protein FlgG
VSNAGELPRSSGSNFLADGRESFPAAESEYSISQGFLEGANTNPIIEMQAMIQLNKEYESTQKVIAALDRSLEQANEIGKV